MHGHDAPSACERQHDAAVCPPVLPLTMPQTVKPKDEIECFCCGQTYVAGDNMPVEQAQHVCDANGSITRLVALTREFDALIKRGGDIQRGPKGKDAGLECRIAQALANAREHFPYACA